MRNDRFAKYDKEVGRNPFQTKKNQMVVGSKWNKNDGPFPGVFDRRQAGNRCLWSAQWYTVEGMVKPDDIMPLPSMTSGEIIAEAVDLIYQRPGDPHLGRALVPRVLDYYSGLFPDPNVLMTQIIGILGPLRQSYQEFTCPWSVPRGRDVVYQRFRPGWIDPPPVVNPAQKEVSLV